MILPFPCGGRWFLGAILFFISSRLLCAQDAVRIPRTNRSMLQPEMEAQVQQPSAFVAADHMTGDWGGARERLFDAGIDVFAFDNSIYNGNVSGGIHPGHATIVNDFFAGMKFDLREARRLARRLVRRQRDRSRGRGPDEQICRQYLFGAADGRRAAAVPLSGVSAAEALR